MKIRRSGERGQSELGWLHSRHSFSFGDYHDPANMGFRALRVINEDVVEPGQGFGTHGHRDMEIISIVLAGALEHKDSLGHGETLRPGEVQVMSAGTGIRHSEFNPSDRDRVHFLQVWIQPDRSGHAPAYAQATFPAKDRVNRLVRVAGRARADDRALAINQDADMYLSRLEARAMVRHGIRTGRAAWVQVISGTCTVNGVALEAGDAAGIEGDAEVELASGPEAAEVLLFDLA